MYNILNVIKDICLGRLSFIDKQEAKIRYLVCQECEVRNKLLNICTICGCSIPLKVKLTKSECPMGRW